MAKPKACRNCNRVYEGEKCPDCGSEDYTENFKGRIVLMNPEKSEIAGRLKLKEKGNFALKTR
ncbi:MAG TPA: transcription elongation factor subunit Spt4 [Candidatus Nanoarchaeia archaeon]|nr:transcription elongation factor subunit Spt4 [Candidatus Nanoarchaeia archaeon]